MLWSNAVEVWSHDFILGNGVAWKDLWVAARYRDVGFDLIHNGYLEVAVRYGLVGLAFYGALYLWSVAMARRASARGLIPRQAFNFHVVSLVFFLATIMTNSNNRLAIGESYMLVAAAFGFFCHFACLYQDRIGAPAVATPLHESEKAARHVPA
jgi:O-antigen ligase